MLAPRFLLLFPSKQVTQLETDMKDLSLIKWSPSGPHLAIGTAKGNLLIYNKRTLKKVPIVGKHTKKITCGAWNNEGKLALGGEDRQITLTTAEGEHISNITVKNEPVDLQFSDIKSDERTQGGEKDTTISVNMGKQTILLYNIGAGATGEKPLELAFQAKYGSISSYRWFGDGYVGTTHNKQKKKNYENPIHNYKYIYM